MTTFEDSIQAAQQTLERIKQAAPRLSRPARRELLRRLKDINAGQARAQAAQAVGAFLERSRNGNDMGDVEQAISNSIDVPERTDRPESGGRRVNATWHGVPIYEDEE